MPTLTADVDQWNLLQAKAQASRLASTFDAFRQAGIEPVLVKGWAAARKYPSTQVRRPGDIDLAVDPDDYDRAWKLARSSESSHLNIDLHRGLRQLDAVDWDDLFERSILIDLNGTSIRVLCEEDHLRVLSTHWLIDGGSYKDKLWDIYYAVENRSPDFDWDRCLGIVSPIRRRWLICAIAIAHKYLELRVDDLPFERELRNIPQWISNCVEKEWARAARLEPILTSTHDKKLLLDQIARRIPPNPIRSTIEAEGDLYGKLRIYYQAKVIGRRLFPFLRDLFLYLKLKARGTNG